MHLRVGIVMVIGIAILAMAIFSIGGGLRWLSGSEELTARFQRVNGLQIGAPVHLSGVNIGSVASIQFPQRSARQLRRRAAQDRS